jgi:mannose/fructose/N-acetylgalactosamine-specific phosphotransferase system component IIC
MPSELFLALAAAALLNLDRLALGQNAISRPLVVGLLLGLILKKPSEGLTLGLWAEVLWLARPPLGGSIIPNGSLALAAVLCGLAAQDSRAVSDLCAMAESKGLTATFNQPGRLVLGLALIPPLAHLMNLVEPVTRNIGQRIHAEVVRRLENDQELGLWSLNLKAISATFGAALPLICLGAALVAGVFWLASLVLPLSLWAALERFRPLTPVICLSFMAMGLSKRKLLGFLTAAVIFTVILVIFF